MCALKRRRCADDTRHRLPDFAYNRARIVPARGAEMSWKHWMLFLFAPIAMAQDFSKVEIKVKKVAGSVYMLQGAGGNIGVSVGDDVIVIVDDQFTTLAEKIQTALKGINEKQLLYDINT